MERIKCAICGRFIAYQDFENGTAVAHEGPWNGASYNYPGCYYVHIQCENKEE